MLDQHGSGVDGVVIELAHRQTVGRRAIDRHTGRRRLVRQRLLRTSLVGRIQQLNELDGVLDELPRHSHEPLRLLRLPVVPIRVAVTRLDGADCEHLLDHLQGPLQPCQGHLGPPLDEDLLLRLLQLEHHAKEGVEGVEVGVVLQGRVVEQDWDEAELPGIEEIANVLGAALVEQLATEPLHVGDARRQRPPTAGSLQARVELIDAAVVDLGAALVDVVAVAHGREK
mmetsp:Transcript_21338/g.52182  ORF Transcript_21338/g.52182 Transcript_21338/m.52182 type:complete len:227 (-) Transcript_21338:105-785(-)